jgi:thymidylate synthase
MIAHVTGLKPGELIHTMGDAHVYNDHIDALTTQLEREPRPFPKLRIARDVKDIDDFKFEDFVVEGYNPHKKIDMKMSV